MASENCVARTVPENVHEANPLNSLVAEQEATRTALKKFMFVEVVPIKLL